MPQSHNGASLAPHVTHRSYLAVSDSHLEERHNPMKLFKTFLAASALAVPSAVLAASPTSTLSVHVPFSFTMAGQDFEPGDYRVQQSDNGVICIQGSGKAAMAISVPGSPAKSGAPSALQFNSGHLVGIQIEGAEIRLLPQDQPETKVTLTSTR